MSGSLMVCNSVYAAGQVSLQHVFTASQLCRQAMHHDQAHHPLVCHNILQSYTCSSETLQSCQTQVGAAQYFFLGPTQTSQSRDDAEMCHKICKSTLTETCFCFCIYSKIVQVQSKSIGKEILIMLRYCVLRKSCLKYYNPSSGH